MESRVEQAVKYFSQDYNCAQSIFMAYGVGPKLTIDQAKLIASTFGGGMAREGEVCGAVTGALMAIGIALSQKSKQLTPGEYKEQVYDLSRKFMDRFRELHGAVRCADLLGLLLKIPEQRQKAIEQNLMTTRCPQYVKSAAEILETIL